MVLSDKVHVQSAADAKYGGYSQGLFASAPIKKGEWVWRWVEDEEPLHTYTRQQILNWPNAAERDRLITYSYMIGHDVYGSDLVSDDTLDPGYFFNHSCEPNCCYQTDMFVMAARDIEEGEELVYDYAFTETEASLHAGMQCRCGSKKCRGLLTFREYRDPAFLKENLAGCSEYIQRKAAEVGWHDPRVIVQAPDSEPDCKGLCALEPIEKDEVVVIFGGKVVGQQQLQAFLLSDPEGGHHHLQVAEDLWQIPAKPGAPEAGDHINHSCDPSCRMRDSVTVVAWRDIQRGEQLTIDYATVISGVAGAVVDTFSCKCGAANCRGVVTQHDWMKQEVQARYADAFPPFMKQLISKSAKGSSVPAGNGAAVVEG